MQDTVTKSAVPDQGVDQAKQEGAEQSGYYGLQILPPLSAVFELAVIVGLLFAVDWLLPAIDINNIQPSPYWLPVLLLTLHYGTASGTLAVIVAIIAYFAFVTLPEQGVGENEFAYRLRILSQPILWIATAVFLGQFRMVQISAKRELRRRARELETQRDTLADYAQRLRARCDALERDIAARPINTTAPLLNALAGLANAKDSIAADAESALAAAFPAASVSLYARNEHGLTKLVSTGWPPSPPWPSELDLAHPLAKAIITAKSKPTILDTAGEAVLDGQGLAAVPVIDPATGRVTGMLKLDRADAALMTLDITRHLDGLAAALEPSLARLVKATHREPGPLERNLLKISR